MKESNEEKIMTLNLNGKKGVHILVRRYDTMKNSILKALKDNGQVTLAALSALVEADIGDTFDGKIGWYLMAVKLDLEARVVIEKTPRQTPQTLRLTQ